jgi:hypothetical protein
MDSSLKSVLVEVVEIINTLSKGVLFAYISGEAPSCIIVINSQGEKLTFFVEQGGDCSRLYRLIKPSWSFLTYFWHVPKQKESTWVYHDSLHLAHHRDMIYRYVVSSFLMLST